VRLNTTTEIRANRLRTRAADEVVLKVDNCAQSRFTSSPAKTETVKRRPVVVIETRGKTIRRINCPIMGLKAAIGLI
jgi:hypothetical protein